MIVSSIVIKIASRCNLNCTYCYVYNLGDNTYLSQPKLMSYSTVDILIQRVLEHCLDKKLKNFAFIFHGGEPLLQKKEFFSYFITNANEILLTKHGIQPSFSVQTNGLLLSEEWCEHFNRLNVGVGISLDGYKEVNDRYRVDHKGKGSYDNVVKGLEIAQKNLESKPGILSVMDVDSDPIKFYKNIKELGVTYFDLLWPHATHDSVASLNEKPTDHSNAPYADWLIKIFDLWFSEKHENENEISVFETFINLILGKEDFGNEDFGSDEIGLLVIETNGDTEVVGALKICGNGFTKNGANIKTHSFSEALETKLASLYYNSHKMLPKKCTQCPIVDICGGGHIHTRFSKENGFNNPSVYCEDFIKLITHIQNVMFDSLPEKYQKEMDKVMHKDIQEYFDKLDISTIETPDYTKKLSSF